MITTLALAAVFAAPKLTPYTWKSVAIVGGGFVSGIVTHPKVKDAVFARTDIGGAYRWDAKAKHWIPLQDWLTGPDWNLYGVESLAVDPTDPKRIYIAAGTYSNSWGFAGAILSSADSGKTFFRANLPFKNGGNEQGRSMGERLNVDPNQPSHLLFGTRKSGLWSSDDYGHTWFEVKSFPKVTPEMVIEKDTTWGAGGVMWTLFDGKSGQAGKRTPVIYAAMAAKPGIYVSRNEGRDWAPVPGQPLGWFAHHGVLAADGTLYVTYGNGPGPNDVTAGAVYKRLKNGTWVEITPVKMSATEHFGYAGLTLDVQHPGTVMVSTLDRWGRDTIFRSLDGGSTWSSIAETARRDSAKAPYLKFGHPEAEFGHWLGDIEIDPFNSNHAWYVTGATIWETFDLTNVDKKLPTHWVVDCDNFEETASIDLVSPPVGAQVITALGDIGGFRHDNLDVSPPGGMIDHPMLSSVDDIDYAGKRPEVIARVGRSYSGQKGGYSFDGGLTWSTFANDVPKVANDGGTVAITADGATTIWSPNRAVACWSTDWGKTWNEVSGLPIGARVLSDKGDSKVVYGFAPKSVNFFVSRDGGRSFVRVATPISGVLEKAETNFDRPHDLWVPTSDGVWHSADAGEHFTKLSSVKSGRYLGFGKAAAGSNYPAIYMIGGVDGVEGVFRSLNAGATWTQINDATLGLATMNNITGDPKKFGRVYLGTNGRGVFYADQK